nr:sorting nexin-3 isoform X2 [Microcebus murinus]
MAETVADTRRLITKPQNLNDAYGPPSNFLEIDVSNPQTVGVGRGRFTTYEIRVKTNLPIFKLKESTVRRRYSDFEWLRSELERESKPYFRMTSEAWSHGRAWHAQNDGKLFCDQKVVERSGIW